MRLDRRRALSLLTLGASLGAPARAASPVVITFQHGVASGDPRTDGAVLWTRVTPEQDGPVDVRWEAAEDAGFRHIVARGAFRTGPERDYTVKVEATGLRPGRDYSYRFRAGGTVSPTGRMRTLPVGGVTEVKLAVVSCSLIPAGFFNAYDHIARGPKLDAVLHLGDYIYEYGARPGDYGVSDRTPPERMPQPPHEVITLADYRARHAQYKRDPDLQAAHAAAPWITVWDDHEVANDTWIHGAENHQPVTEGPFDRRKAAALQAYYEWMPIREPAPGRAHEAIERSFDFGDLATLVMVETRLQARSQQLRYDDPTLAQAAYDATDPLKVVRVADAALEKRLVAEAAAGRPLPAPYRVLPDVPALVARLSEPSREMMGPRQQAWVAGEVQRSVAAGRPWQVLGNQVIMGRAKCPDPWRQFGVAQTQALAAGLPQAAAARLLRTGALGQIGAPYNLDDWDGYPAARERLLQALKAAGGNTVVVSGDSHAFWVNALHDDAAGAQVAVEFGTSGVTSPSVGDSLPGVDYAGMMTAQNPEIRFNDQNAKGYVRLTLTRGLARGEFIATGVARPYAARTVAAWTVAPTRGPGVGELRREV